MVGDRSLTTHPRFHKRRSTYRPSYGQCGVSCAWLQAHLKAEARVHTAFVRGSLIFSDRRFDAINDHCWLDYQGDDGESWVIDVTADQTGYEHGVIVDRAFALPARGMAYQASVIVKLNAFNLYSVTVEQLEPSTSLQWRLAALIEHLPE